MAKRAIERVENGVRHVFFKDPTSSGVIALPLEAGKSPYADDGHTWTWDGDEMNPTISPSVKSSNDHFFVRGGKVEFCSDAKHENAGKTVQLGTLAGFFDEE